MVNIYPGRTLLYKSDKLCTSTANKYYPLYAYADVGSGPILSKYVRAGVFTYPGPPDSSYYRNRAGSTSHKYIDLIEQFQDSISRFRFKLKIDDDVYRLPAMMGILLSNEFKPLMIFAGRKNPYDYPPGVSAIPNEDTTLLVSTDLVTNDIYRNLYRKLHKEIILPCHVKGIEVTYQTSEAIQEQVFSNEFKLNFSTIDELQHHLDNEVSELLYQDVLPF